MSDQQFDALKQQLDAMMTFMVTKADIANLVTKEELESTVQTVVGASEMRLRAEMHEMRIDLRQEINRAVTESHDSLLGEMRAGFQGVAGSIEALSDLIDDDFQVLDERLSRLEGARA